MASVSDLGRMEALDYSPMEPFVFFSFPPQRAVGGGLDGDGTYLAPVARESRALSSDYCHTLGLAIICDIVDAHLAIPGGSRQVVCHRRPADRGDGIGGISRQLDIICNGAACAAACAGWLWFVERRHNDGKFMVRGNAAIQKHAASARDIDCGRGGRKATDFKYQVAPGNRGGKRV